MDGTTPVQTDGGRSSCCGRSARRTRCSTSSTSGTRRYEGRRLFSELFGTFLLVLVAVGGGMVNARFGGSAVPYGALVVAPALMVAAIILFMGAVSGAHLNPAVSIAFALRGDFPWRRVPAYIVAQLLGAVLATLLLWALLGKQGDRRSHPARRGDLDPHRDGVGDRPHGRAWSAPSSACPPARSSWARSRRSASAATSRWPGCGAHRSAVPR